MALELQKPDDEIEDNKPQQDDVEQPQSEDEPIQDGADEAEEVDESQEPEEIDSQPEAKPSRGESRIQRLANEAREAREEAARVRREVEELKARQNLPPPVQEREPTPDEMALWSTDQIVEHRMKKSLAPLERSLQQAQFQIVETADKAEFSALCARDPRAARMAEKVEAAVQAERARGVNVPRAAALRYLLGDSILQAAPKAAVKQKQEGQRRIARQQAPSGNARSDQSADRRELSEKEARNKRLRDAGFFN